MANIDVNNLATIKHIGFGALSYRVFLHKSNWHSFHIELKNFAKEYVMGGIRSAEDWLEGLDLQPGSDTGLNGLNKDSHNTNYNSPSELAFNLQNYYEITLNHYLCLVPNNRFLRTGDPVTEDANGIPKNEWEQVNWHKYIESYFKKYVRYYKKLINQR